MLSRFTTPDGSIWTTDLEKMRFARVASDKPDAEILEFGKLVVVGVGLYAMEGRTEKTEGAGNGICSFGIRAIPRGTAIDIFLKANVDVHDFTIVNPITEIRTAVFSEAALKEAVLAARETEVSVLRTESDENGTQDSSAEKSADAPEPVAAN